MSQKAIDDQNTDDRKNTLAHILVLERLKNGLKIHVTSYLLSLYYHKKHTRKTPITA